MLILILVALVGVGRFIERRITGPAQELATRRKPSAAGDLSKPVSQIGSDDEIGRLARAITAMIGELRRLALALNESASETASATSEITASSEEMAASAGEIAHTASDLSQQSNVMAETIQTLAGSSEDLVGIASELDKGALEGVARNTQLRSSRSKIGRAWTTARGRFSRDVDDRRGGSAAAIDQLAQASEEVRGFVTLVQKLARQSKLLALNAAMEAARAGDHGTASRWWRGSAPASPRCRRTPRSAPSKVERRIEWHCALAQPGERTVDTVRAVRGATEEGSRSFGQIERRWPPTDGRRRFSVPLRRRTIWLRAMRSSSTRSRLNGIVRRRDAGSRCIERGAKREHGRDRGRGVNAGEAADRLSRLAGNLRLDDAPEHRTETYALPMPPVRVPPDVTTSRPTPVRSGEGLVSFRAQRDRPYNLATLGMANLF